LRRPPPRKFGTRDEARFSLNPDSGSASALISPVESAPSSYPDALPVGTALGEFTISEVIGVGGCGIVTAGGDRPVSMLLSLDSLPPQKKRRAHTAHRSTRAENSTRLRSPANIEKVLTPVPAHAPSPVPVAVPVALPSASDNLGSRRVSAAASGDA